MTNITLTRLAVVALTGGLLTACGASPPESVETATTAPAPAPAPSPTSTPASETTVALSNYWTPLPPAEKDENCLAFTLSKNGFLDGLIQGGREVGVEIDRGDADDFFTLVC